MSKEIYYLHWGNRGVFGKLTCQLLGRGCLLSYEPLTEEKFSYPTGLYPVKMVGRKTVTDKSFVPTHLDIITWLESRIYTAESQLVTSTLNAMGLSSFDVWEVVKKLNGKSADDKWWIVSEEEQWVPEYTFPALYLENTFSEVKKEVAISISNPSDDLTAKHVREIRRGYSRKYTEKTLDNGLKVRLRIKDHKYPHPSDESFTLIQNLQEAIDRVGARKLTNLPNGKRRGVFVAIENNKAGSIGRKSSVISKNLHKAVRPVRTSVSNKAGKLGRPNINSRDLDLF